MDKHVPALDGLRGTAILLVVFFHYGFPELVEGSIPWYLVRPIVRLGWSGVDLFFVLSGFLICRVLLSETSIPRFWLRRAARTMPLYFLMLLIFLFGIALQRSALVNLPQLFHVDLRSLWVYFILMQNNHFAIYGAANNFISVSWSLAIEEQFYLVFPLLFLLRLKKAQMLAALFAITALSLTARCIHSTGLSTWGNGLNDWQYLFTLCRLDGLAAGAAIAVALDSERSVAFLRLHRHLLLIPAIMLGGVLVIAIKWTGSLGPFLPTCLALFYASLLLMILAGHPIAAIVRASILRFFGDISYGLYLIHAPMIIIIASLIGVAHTSMTTILALSISIGLAYLSRHRLELPLINAARHWKGVSAGGLNVNLRSSSSNHVQAPSG
jgi:peptidoglycan/LPS O-acetylase OafA/YrhL